MVFQNHMYDVNASHCINTIRPVPQIVLIICEVTLPTMKLITFAFHENPTLII